VELGADLAFRMLDELDAATSHVGELEQPIVEARKAPPGCTSGASPREEREDGGQPALDAPCKLEWLAGGEQVVR